MLEISPEKFRPGRLSPRAQVEKLGVDHFGIPVDSFKIPRAAKATRGSIFGGIGVDEVAIRELSVMQKCNDKIPRMYTQAPSPLRDGRDTGKRA